MGLAVGEGVGVDVLVAVRVFVGLLGGRIVHPAPLAPSRPPERSPRKLRSRRVADRSWYEPLVGGRLLPTLRPPLSRNAWCSRLSTEMLGGV